MPSHHHQALWGPSVPHTAQPTACHAVSLPSCHSCSTSYHLQPLGQNHLLPLQAGPQNFICWPVLSKNLSWEVSVACFSFLCTPSPREVSHACLGTSLPVWFSRLLKPLQNTSGGAARASGPFADSVASRMLVSPATAPVRFCEEGLPAGSACYIVVLPLQLASSLLQCLKIE